FALHGSTFRADARGRVDLTRNAVEGLELAAQAPRGTRFLGTPELEDARITARLDGTFGDLAIAHVVTLGHLRAPGFEARGLRTAATAH
ncbi:hypothetical protein ABTB94_20730, partial [Acinetobacter baumannii]